MTQAVIYLQLLGCAVGGHMTSDAEKAVEYRKRAEELRQLAATFKNAASRNEILALAAEWDVMADRAERRAKRKPT